MMLRQTLLVCAFGFCSFAIGQNDLTEEITDTTGDYTAFWMHDSLTNNHSHLVDHNDEWKIWGGFFCFGELFVDDKMAFGLAAEHRIAPHQESPSDIYVIATLVIPDDYPSDPRVLNLNGEQMVIAHEQHFDIHNSQGALRLAYFLGKADIAAYNLMMVGVHTDNPEATVSIDAESIRENVLGITDDDSIGLTSMRVNPSTGDFRLDMTVTEEPWANLGRVTLHLGAPGQNGPMVYDLGGQAEWTDGGGKHVSRSLTGTFPQQAMGALLNGQVYVQVTNTQHPDGAIRGQMTRTPYGVQPAQFHVIRGATISGGLDQLRHADDDRLVVQKSLTVNSQEDAVQVEVGGWSWLRQPTTMTVQVEAHAASPSIRQTIQLFNFQTGAYEVVDQRIVGLSDSRTEVTVSQNPARFLDANGNTRAIVSFGNIGPTTVLAWQTRLDQVHWVLTR